MRWSHTLLSLVLVQPLLAVPPRHQTAALRAEASPMRLRASGVWFTTGTTNDMTAEDLARSRADEYWQEARWQNTLFFPSHLGPTNDGGLGVYTLSAKTWTVYPMFSLATAAGWYKPLPNEDSLPEHISGVAIGGGRVWMGTSGLGIVARDLREGTWSRHDFKDQGLPGIHSTVYHADDQYVIGQSGGASHGWKERLPGVSERDVGPALEIYSLRRNRWIRIRAVPRENVITFGWTNSGRVSIACNTRHHATSAFLPLEMCTYPAYVKASPEHRGYELGRAFDDPGEPLRYVIRASQLESAFGATTR
jgi:hypothetical protein